MTRSKPEQNLHPLFVPPVGSGCIKGVGLGQLGKSSTTFGSSYQGRRQAQAYGLSLFRAHFTFFYLLSSLHALFFSPIFSFESFSSHVEVLGRTLQFSCTSIVENAPVPVHKCWLEHSNSRAQVLLRTVQFPCTSVGEDTPIPVLNYQGEHFIGENTPLGRTLHWGEHSNSSCTIPVTKLNEWYLLFSSGKMFYRSLKCQKLTIINIIKIAVFLPPSVSP